MVSHPSNILDGKHCQVPEVIKCGQKVYQHIYVVKVIINAGIWLAIYYLLIEVNILMKI